MDPFDLTREEVDFERLASYLKALAHPGRLELLWRLRIPATSSEVEIKPRRRDANLPQQRPMSRQAIEGHLDVLEEVGAVLRNARAEGGAAQWVTNNQRVFAIIEDLRKLTAIRPTTKVDIDTTIAGEAGFDPGWPTGPKLVLVGGPWEGRAFALDGSGPWTLGRSRSAAVSLSYDPFVSAEHAEIQRDGDAFAVRPRPGTRNPCLVNFKPVVGDDGATLGPGAIVGVGRSLLVYHDV